MFKACGVCVCVCVCGCLCVSVCSRGVVCVDVQGLLDTHIFKTETHCPAVSHYTMSRQEHLILDVFFYITYVPYF